MICPASSVEEVSAWTTSSETLMSGGGVSDSGALGSVTSLGVVMCGGSRQKCDEFLVIRDPSGRRAVILLPFFSFTKHGVALYGVVKIFFLGCLTKT